MPTDDNALEKDSLRKRSILKGTMIRKKWRTKQNCGTHSIYPTSFTKVLRWCYTGRFATTIFSATKRCNIVPTLFPMVTTLFQHCNAVLCKKSSLRIVPCNITFTAECSNRLSAWVRFNYRRLAKPKKIFSVRVWYQDSPSEEVFQKCPVHQRTE